MGKEKRKVEVGEVFHANLSPSALFRKLNNLIELVDRASADTNSLHGDGLFPVNKENNGKVSASTGMSVEISDYLGLIDGYKVHLSAARVFSATKKQTLAITKTGEFYIGLQLQGVDVDLTGSAEVDDTEEVEKQNQIKDKYGFLPEHGEAVPVEIDASEVTMYGDKPEVEGKIILAKLTVPAEATEITADMIDNSVKDYLIDIDALRRDLESKLDEIRRVVYQEIVDAIEALKVEIADGDAAVLAEVESKIAVLEGQIADNSTAITDIQTNLQDLNDYVVNELTPRMDQISSDLDDAVSNLAEVIENETALLDAKIEENLGKLAVLQAEVEAPVTGLLDRVTALEEAPQVPADIYETLQDLEERVAYLEEFGGGGGGPTFVNHQIAVADIDESSTYDVDAQGKLTLPVNTAAQVVVADTCDGTGPIDTDKWTLKTGVVTYTSDQMTMGTYSQVYTNNATTDFDLQFDVKHFATGSTHSSQSTYVVFRHLGSKYYKLNLFTQGGITAGKSIFVEKWDSGRKGYIYKSYDSLTISEGEMVTYRLVVEGNNIKVYAKGTLMIDFDDNNWTGRPFFNYEDYLYIGSTNRGQVLDSFDCKHVNLGTVYEASGEILTTQLESTSPINQAFIQGTVNVPADTAVQYEVSLNGGTNWQVVTLDELVDGTAAPWSGAGDNYLVKITMSTTDTSKSPAITAIAAVSKI